MTARIFVATCVVAALAVATGVFARRLARLSRLRWLVNVLIPGMQAVIMAFLLTCFIMFDLPVWLYALVVIIGVCCVIVDFALLQALQVSEDRELAQQRARLLDEQVALQAEHLARVEADARRACDVRLEIAERLREAARALDDADGGVAPGDQGVRCVQLRLDADNRLCDHPVIDALLTSKFSECERRGIKVTHSLRVPAQVGLPNVDVCAAFSNMLDNAMAACEQVGPGSSLDVKARLSGGFMVIEVANSCLEQDAGVKRKGRRSVSSGDFGTFDASDGEVLREHGWGMGILRSIAERHDGMLSAEREGAVFRTALLLKLGE